MALTHKHWGYKAKEKISNARAHHQGRKAYPEVYAKHKAMKKNRRW